MYARRYKGGRKGEPDILKTDSENEAVARQEGQKAKIDADETRKEDEEAKKQQR